MRHTKYTLTPTRIHNAKPKAKPCKLTDGAGLYLQVIPSGAKTWRYQYKLGGTRGEVTIGKYPEIGVADARDRHLELCSMVERGQAPAELRRKEREERKERMQKATQTGDDFEAFSRRWIRERVQTKSRTYREQIEY